VKVTFAGLVFDARMMFASLSCCR